MVVAIVIVANIANTAKNFKPVKCQKASIKNYKDITMAVTRQARDSGAVQQNVGGG